MHRLNEEEDKLVKIYTKLCELIGSPVTPNFLEIKKYAETGHWRVGSWVGVFFSGFLLGLIFTIRKKKEGKKDDFVSAIALLEEAMIIRKKIYQLEQKDIRLIKQGN